MTLAIPIRQRNNASQANCFGFCTCTPSFLRGRASSLLSADTKSPRICTFHSYFKSRIFNARAAHRTSFRLTHFVSADARYRGGTPVQLRFKSRHSHRPPSALLREPLCTLRLCGIFSHGLSLSPARVSPFDSMFAESRFAIPFRMNVCIMWVGGYPPSLPPPILAFRSLRRNGWGGRHWEDR